MSQLRIDLRKSMNSRIVDLTINSIGTTLSVQKCEPFRLNYAKHIIIFFIKSIMWNLVFEEINLCDVIMSRKNTT